MTACLECPLDGCPDVTTGPCLAEADVSWCLSPPGSTGDGTTWGCLEPPTSGSFLVPETTSSGSGTDTDTDTDTDTVGTETGSDPTSAGDPGGDRPGERARTLRNLIDAGILPRDLVDRLRGRQ
jgi:hypothetical protein